MTITVTELITNAFYASGIVSRDFNQVTGPQLAGGHQLLNDILAEKLLESDMIPYYTSHTLTGVIGQEAYFIENLIEADTFTFVIDSVRFPTIQANRQQYFGTARANNVNSLPFQWHLERTLNGANFYIYFTPDQAYTCEIWGKFGLAATTGLTQDLELVYDRYYLSYLKYQLAKRICVDYNFAVPVGVSDELGDFERKIKNYSAIVDVSLNTTDGFPDNDGLTWAQVNLGKGWTRA